MADTLLPTNENPKVNGGPVKRIECKLASVQIRISWRAFTAAIISEPEDRRWPPAVLVADGVQSNGLS